jgi:flagellar hook assembly protein FlgD
VEYQIEVIDGEFTQLDIPMCETVDVEEHEIPHNSSLISHLSNYPNPFNPTTNISFNLSFESDVSLSIYNIKGQLVKQLVNEQLSAGPHTIEWNGKDSNNKSVSSGIYYYKISSGKDSAINKMLLLK